MIEEELQYQFGYIYMATDINLCELIRHEIALLIKPWVTRKIPRTFLDANQREKNISDHNKGW